MSPRRSGEKEMKLFGAQTNKWRWLMAAAILLILLLGIRIALPGWVTEFLNRNMEVLGEYQCHIEDVDLHLWRGAYSIRQMTVVKNTGDIPVPFMDIPELDLALRWSAVLRGKFVAQAILYQPEINFVDGGDRASQSGLGVDWRKQLESLAPFRLDEVQVKDGVVWFRNFSSDPQVDLQANQVQLVVRNLTNIVDEGDRAASFDLAAAVLGHAPLNSEGHFDPFTPYQDFRYRLKIDQIDLTQLNEFLQAYAHLDAASGTGNFVMEIEAVDGQLSGYAKPLFENVQIFSWEQDVERQEDNPFRLLWESIAGGIENLFKNQEQDLFATKVEIKGEVNNAQTSPLQAIVGILINAFVEAYRPQFEGLPSREQDSG
jgi:hypothetical protein